MRAILDATIFQQTHLQDLALLECFALARAGRHVILSHSSVNPMIERWIDTQAPSLQEELRAILEMSQLRDANLSAARTITLIAGLHSDWPNARLCLQDAVRLLREPLHILLENARNDLAFLRRLAPPDHRRALEDAIAQGWVVIDQGGGLSEIQQIIDLITQRDALPHHRFLRCRLWVLFDRDSHRDDRALPSADSQALLDALAPTHLDDPWHIDAQRLERRAIENYLPLDSLWRWVYLHEPGNDEAPPENTSTNTQQHRRAAVNALASLRRDDHAAARQYNMKAGLVRDLRAHYLLKKQLDADKQILRADLPRLASRLLDEHCDPLFRGRPDEERAALAYGLDEHIANLYTTDDDPGFDQTFQAEYDRGGHALTREAILEQLLQRL
jgi:hypothetical protein